MTAGMVEVSCSCGATCTVPSDPFARLLAEHFMVAHVDHVAPPVQEMKRPPGPDITIRPEGPPVLRPSNIPPPDHSS